jgi:hypothetical protein
MKNLSNFNLNLVSIRKHPKFEISLICLDSCFSTLPGFTTFRVVAQWAKRTFSRHSNKVSLKKCKAEIWGINCHSQYSRDYSLQKVWDCFNRTFRKIWKFWSFVSFNWFFKIFLILVLLFPMWFCKILAGDR